MMGLPYFGHIGLECSLVLVCSEGLALDQTHQLLLSL